MRFEERINLIPFSFFVAFLFLFIGAFIGDPYEDAKGKFEYVLTAIFLIGIPFVLGFLSKKDRW